MCFQFLTILLVVQRPSFILFYLVTNLILIKMNYTQKKNPLILFIRFSLRIVLSYSPSLPFQIMNDEMLGARPQFRKKAKLLCTTEFYSESNLLMKNPLKKRPEHNENLHQFIYKSNRVSICLSGYLQLKTLSNVGPIWFFLYSKASCGFR